MKQAIAILLIGISINQLNSQSKANISEIEERNVEGKSLIYVDNKKFNGVVYENYIVKKQKYSVKDGKKEGPYEYYYETGQLKRKTFFINAKIDGPYEE